MEAVVAVVVAYNPGDTMVDLCRQLVAQGCAVHVIDNASQDAEQVLDRCRDLGGVVQVLDGNVGVAGALTEALEVVPPETQWIFTFDQDSEVPEGYVAAMTGSAAVDLPSVALVGPVVRDRRTGVLQQGDPARTTWYDVPRLITSGALCRVSALRAVGGFRRELFIDYVDFDLCVRLRRAGFRVAVEPSVELSHSIGHLTRHRLPGGLEVGTTHHGSDRQYYRYRNFVLLTRDGTFRHEDRPWKLRSALALVLAPVKILLFESDRRGKVSAISRGVTDGLASRTGARVSSRGWDRR
jgi:rhamnosyltransferase